MDNAYTYYLEVQSVNNNNNNKTQKKNRSFLLISIQSIIEK